MHDTLRPLLLNALLWLCAVTLLFAAREFAGPTDNGWLDLTLVLIAYVLLFLLAPMQKSIHRRLRKRHQRRETRHRPEHGA
ncbi:hypothetical protein [Pseudomonas sp.]|uniref:hypothetical protein n=1 Tax=Pseudomonas sp. TaxID=306 RepID=UPI003C41129F